MCGLSTCKSEPAANYRRQLREWRPDAIAISCNYLANVPEVIDLAKEAGAIVPEAFVFAGGHSASFIAGELLEHADGRDRLRAQRGRRGFDRPAARGGRRGDRRDLLEVPGVITPDGQRAARRVRQKP